MAVDINSIIVLITLFIVFGIFLFYDFFRKGQKIGFLAYIVAVIPINYLWAIGYDVLGVYMVLFIAWDVVLLRDLFIVYRKNKEYDDIILFLGLGILAQLIISMILPANQFNPRLQENTIKIVNTFYMPDIYTGSFGIESWVNRSILMGFRIAATVCVILVVIPMLLDIKDEEDVHPIVVVIITAIFIIPFLYLSYIWLPQSFGVLTPLFCVILFIILFMLTKGKQK